MEQPRVLLISLNLESWFDEMYKPHLDKLRAKARIQRAKTARTALRELSSSSSSSSSSSTEHPPPAAVLITDAALADPAAGEHAAVLDAVLQYVRRGGTAVCLAHFPSFVAPPDMQPFFRRAGLPWEAGAYERTTFALNRAAVGASLADRLPARYSMKALAVANVAPEQAWYCTDEQSVLESLVWGPEPVRRPGQAPVAVGRVGEGRLAYVGDVNVEEGTGEVILALCGLL
ncbi:ec13d0af-0fdd-4131-8eec-aabb123d2c42 [Thermothielavioides terrestris]|uniref:Uncharacterized protein n=2 Tax=Thermothielavioides terrestris TaxID=2587410 RepID=G2QRD0_THETT|nr:uncharacterized protein THITE_2110050 [Thermothielavioides terrestris NRRL 8126]AEO64182.1 hypothetical protein THITE_2110050 [Thermothielavioides terrestris NRRL 8126]SPQ26963.1 ec13d0af-0fdd-4131-8eec-aabb123d2c42 [Thermothielavioides terrestris]